MFGEPIESRDDIPGPAGTRFKSIIHLAEVDSTNRFLLAMARSGAPDGSVVLADHQTAGRGRLGRKWSAPPSSNLLMSILLRTEVPPDHLSVFTIALALAAADACMETAGMLPEIKWPNDLIVGSRKLSGILAESDIGSGPGRNAASGTASPAVVVGIGLNVAWPGRDEDEPGSQLAADALHATSILLETGNHVPVAQLANSILAHFEPRVLAASTPGGRAQLIADYRARCSTIGRSVRIETPSGNVVGEALDVTSEGHLVVEAGGSRQIVSVGDVVHVRPAAT